MIALATSSDTGRLEALLIEIPSETQFGNAGWERKLPSIIVGI
jgi:hypothetical protein